MQSIHTNIEKFQQFYCKPRNVAITNLTPCAESADYSACLFMLQQQRIHFRCSKITPTKVGQFVTFWKRILDSEIMPYDSNDSFDALIIYAQTTTNRGVFIFSKSVLLQQGIISANGIGGKRALRVYPSWDVANNAQAKKSQAWQLKYFTKL